MFTVLKCVYRSGLHVYVNVLLIKPTCTVHIHTVHRNQSRAAVLQSLMTGGDVLSNCVTESIIQQA